MAGARKRGRGDDGGDGGDDAAPAAKLPRAFCAPRQGGIPAGSELAGLPAAEARARTAAARAQVAAVRDAYRKLSAPRAPGDLAALDEAFGALLAATGGCPSAQRLAAEFIPRFASRAPARLDAAAAALAALAEGPGGAADSLAGAARSAAVAGLGTLAAAAAATQGAETRAGKAACAALLRLAARGEASAGDALCGAMEAAPQAVLSSLLLAFVSRDDAALRRGARDWAAAALTPARLGAALEARPATAAWLRASVAALSKGAPPELVAEARHTLDALLRAADAAAPPAGGEHLPPPPPGPQWRGQLRKSGAPVCDVAAQAAPTARATSAAEPAGWPHLLDVLARADTANVLDVLLRDCRPADAALRRLLPLTAPAEMRAFGAYLLERRRCGVVRLSAPARLLYLIPPAPGVAAALEAPEPPRDAPPDYLWALVLPDKPQ